jgi:hypothetical protein
MFDFANIQTLLNLKTISEKSKNIFYLIDIALGSCARLNGFGYF